MKKLFLILTISFFTGCGYLPIIAEEAKQITADEVRPQSESIGILIDGLIPNPYKIPAAVGMGYIIALARRLYKRKKGCKTS